jgi:hypothetical protein
MLRLLVVLLILANIGFYAWTQGKLDDVVGMRSQGDREPERLMLQVRPETIRVLPPATTAAVAAEVPQACLEAGPYTPEQIVAAEGALQTALPAGSWVNVKTEAPAAWIVYMGKYPNREALRKKADELKQLKIPFEAVRNNPELEEGLALGGRYDNRIAADQALAEVVQKGVRTAKVMALSQPTVMHSLRVERADASLQNRLAGLRAEALLSKAFVACSSARP